MSAGNGFAVKDLNRLAQTLADGALEMQSLSANAPSIPDAGESTAVVGAAISSLAGVMSKIVQTAANAAQQAQQDSAAYQNTDDTNTTNFAPLREPR